MSIPKAIDLNLINGTNECANLFQWALSAISSEHSRFSSILEKKMQDKVLHLQRSLQHLRDNLPAMCDLIDRAEWMSHERCVAKLLPKLKEAVYDADDLLDGFRWYELKVAVEGTASQSPFVDFFDSVIQNSLNKVNDIHERVSNISSQLQKMGLREVIQRFDRSVKPETSSFPNETEMFGRDKELKLVMSLLGVAADNSMAGSKRKRSSSPANLPTSTLSSDQDNNESRIPALRVLPIVGIGGIGKTTLAQRICNHSQVWYRFGIIWISVSHDFDVKRLTREAIQSYSGKEATTDNLDLLQHQLSEKVRNTRFLIILDDMCDNALKDNMQCWKKFCAPLRNALQGSMILITTSSPKVAHEVRTIGPCTLDGLKDDAFWNFFKLFTFGFDSSTNDHELERIGKSILPKLAGSPLATKTLGHLLRMNLDPTHWNNILKSELWELKQDENDILPALRLSYMYLPVHLKRCFSFCAVYPKDHKFEKRNLAEIWVAEGFVEPEGDVPILDIGCQYFEDLVNRSFFQRVDGKYVIHDFLHDLALLVSEHDCFIIKDSSDFKKIPCSVRHLSILSSTNANRTNLLSLCEHTKLRTLLCYRSLCSSPLASVLDRWCSEFQHMRVIVCDYTDEIPETIGSLKHLRYLEISGACPFKSLPPDFYCLYNLQVFSARKCKLESFPRDFIKLINLQRFESLGFKYHPRDPVYLNAANEQGIGIRLMKNVNQICGSLTISNLDAKIKEAAAEAELKNKKDLSSLALCWSWERSQEHNEVEVLQVLHPPTGLKSLILEHYPGEYLPSWFEPGVLPCLTYLAFRCCSGLKSKTIANILRHIDLNEIPGALDENNTDSICIFSSLTSLDFYQCTNLSSLDQFLQPAYVPVIRIISIKSCTKLVSLTERFVEFGCLEELTVVDCENIDNSDSLVVPILKKLVLRKSGNLIENIVSRSRPSLSFSCYHVKSIPLQVLSSNLPDLQELEICNCQSLESIGESESLVFTNLPHHGRRSSNSIRTFSSLTYLRIYNCDSLSTLDHILTLPYLPAIEKIHVYCCGKLLSLPGEKFGSFAFLKDLEISNCTRLYWPRGLVLPSSLQRLSLCNCGNMYACLPICLMHLTSLVSLKICQCSGVVSIPGHLWTGSLTSLQNLWIEKCPDLVSIGDAEAIANINKMLIFHCPKLKQPKQPVNRCWSGLHPRIFDY